MTVSITPHSNIRGVPGALISLTGTDGLTYRQVVPAVTVVDSTGNALSPGANNALTAGTDKSGSIATGGSAQDVAAANPSRVGLTFQNTSDTLMRVTENGVTATATTGYAVYPASATATGAVNISTSNRISVFCATTGKTFAATEY